MSDPTEFESLRVHILASLRRLEDEVKLIREAQLNQATEIAKLKTVASLAGATTGAAAGFLGALLVALLTGYL